MIARILGSGCGLEQYVDVDVLVGLVPPLVHSTVHTRAGLASETWTSGPVWVDDGNVVLRHQR